MTGSGERGGAICVLSMSAMAASISVLYSSSFGLSVVAYISYFSFGLSVVACISYSSVVLAGVCSFLLSVLFVGVCVKASFFVF